MVMMEFSPILAVCQIYRFSIDIGYNGYDYTICREWLSGIAASRNRKSCFFTHNLVSTSLFVALVQFGTTFFYFYLKITNVKTTFSPITTMPPCNSLGLWLDTYTIENCTYFWHKKHSYDDFSLEWWSDIRAMQWMFEMNERSIICVPLSKPELHPEIQYSGVNYFLRWITCISYTKLVLNS